MYIYIYIYIYIYNNQEYHDSSSKSIVHITYISRHK